MMHDSNMSRIIIFLLGVIPLCTGMSEAQNILPSASEDVLKILEEAGKNYVEGKCDSALNLWLRLDMESQEAHSLGLNNNDLCYVFFAIGRCYKDKKDYYNAISYFHKSNSLLNKLTELYTWFVPDLYSAIANSYIGIREYEKALEWENKRLRLMIRKYGNESPKLLDSYLSLYYCYRLANNLPQALNILNKYFKLCFNAGLEPESKEKFIDLMLQHVSISYMLNQIDNAYELCQVIENLIDEYQINKIYRLRCCNFMYEILSEKNPEKVSGYINKTIELLEEFEDEEIACDDVMAAFNNISLFYMEENPQEALSRFLLLADYFKEKGDNGKAGYALACNNIGFTMGLEDEKSIDYFEEAFHLTTPLKGFGVAKTLIFGCNWIYSLQYANRWDVIKVALREINNFVSSRLNESFTGLSERNRSLYWNQVKAWYQDILPHFALMLDTPEIWGLLYDGMLQSRSILLCSAMSLKSLIEQSDNPNLKNLYTQSLDLNTIDDTEGLIERLEQRLLNEIKSYGNFMEFFAVDHKKVMNSLDEKDVAIEFVKYSLYSDDSDENINESDTNDTDMGNPTDVRYLALIQTADKEFPMALDICSETDLKDWTLDNLYKIVWTPILKNIGNVSRIYFSPDGEIFSLPIEYAMDSEGRLINENIEICRLSSTREITFKKNAEAKGIALFGGMKFDLSVEEMVADASQYRDASAEMVKERGPRGAISLLQPLPATKVEIETIQSTVKSLSSRDMEVSLFSGNQATEAAFKSCSGKNIKILHIATHGFYNSDMSAFSDDSLRSENDIVNYEQVNMRRSGLLFSGADNVRMEESVPADVEDGILDSYEITNLDFHQTDLVVLSACQTALGAVSGDGVFGLQRGFKKAGVNSILMSLWKVDDEATCYFMSEFYKNLLSESTSYDKIKALREAQNSVRNIPRWSNPRYWGAFILLDALD